MIPYTRLSASNQIDAEERIAALIFDHPDVDATEDAAADLGRAILHEVLTVFCPDVFAKTRTRKKASG